ncbi:MAG: hydrogenase [Deltaproteobacteria bacterium]|nr:hydrogenase [Deltaproteobacteria bacterium]
MTDTLNLLIGIAAGLNLLALASSRLPSMIRAAALQGLVLGVLPLLLEDDWSVLLVAMAAGTALAKGFVIPSLLRRAMHAASIDREVEPLIGFVPSLLLGALATILAMLLSRSLPLLPEHSRTLLLPGALATAICGALLIMARTKAISQVCGYLVLENGAYLFGLLLLRSTPLLVEAGILLDLTVGIFVIGIVVDRIQREFDSLDTRNLTELHE